MKWLLWIGLLSLHCLQAQQKLEVYFDFDADVLTPNARQALDLWKSQSAQFQLLRLEGYCDWKGSTTYNDSLAMRRIRAVQAYLALAAVPTAIQYKAIGERFDLQPEQALNRKVVLWYDKVQPPAPPSLSQRIHQAAVGDKIQLPALFFYNNSPRLLPQSHPTLNEVLCALEENPKLKVQIRGHICCQTQGDLRQVSLARARAIYLYLLRKGIGRNRMTFVGLGTSEPLHPIPEQNAQEEEENRRVEIMVVAQ